MNRTEIQRIAAAIHRLRPDWRADSLETFIATNYGSDPYRDVAIALTIVATDEGTQTPHLVKSPGPWWRAVQVALRQPDTDGVTPRDRCPYHRGEPKACPICAEERRAAEQADTRGHLAAIRRKIQQAPTPKEQQ